MTASKAEREKELSLAETRKDAADRTRKKQEERLQELQEDRDTKLRVTARESGLVVYETRRRRWHRPITVAVGEKINPWQQLIIIPDNGTLVMRTRVYEAVREMVREGQAARITLDARRGKVVRGKVTKVAAVPDSQNPWLSPGVKVYPTTVGFDDNVVDLGLKPGMSGDVEITLAELDDVLSVPIAAVFSNQETTYCYRLSKSGRPERVIVRAGLSSESRLEILSGLAEGDVILLVSPPGEQLPPRSRAKKAEQPTGPPPGMDNDKGSQPKKRGRPRSRPSRPGKATTRPRPSRTTTKRAP